MKNLKKLLAVALILSLVLQTIPVWASAPSDSTIIGFAELPEDIATQYILPDSEELPTLPDTITATVQTTTPAGSIDVATPSGGIDPDPATPSGSIDVSTPAGGIDPETASPAGGLEETNGVLASEIVTTLSTIDIKVVEWTPDKTFTTKETGEFIYTPTLDPAYTLAEGVALPTITVVVGMPPMQTFGAPMPTSGYTVAVNITDRDGKRMTINSGYDPVVSIDGVEYDDPTKTLTIKNADLSTIQVQSVTRNLKIVLDKSKANTINFGNGATATLKVVGQNYITHTDTGGGGGGIYLGDNAEVTVTGTGNINVSTKYAYAIVIDAGATLTLAEDASITATTSVGDGTRARAGVQGQGNLTVTDDAFLKAIGNSVSTGGSGIQLRNNNNSGGIITVSGNGKIEGWAGAGTGTNNVGNGIECRELTVSGGSVSGIAGGTSEDALPTTAGNGIYVRASGGGTADPSIEQTGGKIHGSSKVNCGVRWHGYYDMQGGELVATISERTDQAISSSGTSLQLGDSVEVWTSNNGASNAGKVENPTPTSNWHLTTNYIRIIFPGSSATAPKVIDGSDPNVFEDLKTALENPDIKYVEIKADISITLNATSTINVNGEKHLKTPTHYTTTFKHADTFSSSFANKPIFNIGNDASLTLESAFTSSAAFVNFKPSVNDSTFFNVSGTGELDVDEFIRSYATDGSISYTLLKMTGGTVSVRPTYSARYADGVTPTTGTIAKAIDVTDGELTLRLGGTDNIYSDTGHGLNISGGGKVHFDQTGANGEVRVYGVYIDGSPVPPENTTWFTTNTNITHAEYGSDPLTVNKQTSSSLGDYFLVGSRPSTRLEVNGIPLEYSEHTWDYTSDGGDNHGKATFNFETNTLTLDNFKITKGNDTIIYIEHTSQDLTIELIGTNILSFKDNSTGYSSAIYHDTTGEQGRIIIKGNGTLNANGNYYDAIYASHGLVIDGATVNATYTRQGESGDAVGFSGKADLELKNGATLNATTQSTDSNSHAIGGFGSITINDGSKLNAIANAGYGIHNFNDPIAINNGTIVATATGTGRAFERPPNMDTGNSNFSVWAGGSSPGILVSTPDTGVGGTYYEKYVKMTATPHNYSVSISPTSQTQEALVGYDAGAHAMPVTVTNNGSGALTNVVVTLEGGDVGSFDVTSNYTRTDNTITVGDLAAGESATINITPKANLAPLSSGYYDMYIKVTATEMEGTRSGGYVHFTVKDMIQSIQVFANKASLIMDESDQSFSENITLTTLVNGESGREDELTWSLTGEKEDGSAGDVRSTLTEADGGEKMIAVVGEQLVALIVTAQDPLGGTVGEARVQLKPAAQTTGDDALEHTINVVNGTPSSVQTLRGMDNEVEITANAPPTGQVFHEWTTDDNTLIIVGENSPHAQVHFEGDVDEVKTATVTANYRPIPTIDIDSVTITNPQNSLRQGSTYTYNAVVDAPLQYKTDGSGEVVTDAEGNPVLLDTSGVTWSITSTGHASGTEISADTGVLTIGEGEPANSTITVRAASVHDATYRYAEVDITVRPKASILMHIEVEGEPPEGQSTGLNPTDKVTNSGGTTFTLNGYGNSNRYYNIGGKMVINRGYTDISGLTNGETYTITISATDYVSETRTFTAGEGKDFFGENSIKLKKPSTGVNVIGQVTSYNPQLATTITLTDTTDASNTHTATIAALSTGSGLTTKTFTLEDVPEGNYTLTIEKPGKHVPKIVAVTVGSENVDIGEQKVWLFGDVTFDGRVNSTDMVQIRRYISKLSSLIETGTEQEIKDKLLAANVSAPQNGDSVINSTDVLQIKRYSVKLPSLFDSIV